MPSITLPRAALYTLVGLVVAAGLLLTPRLAPAAPLFFGSARASDGAGDMATDPGQPYLAGDVGLASANALIVLVAGTNVTSTTSRNVVIGEVITYSVVITVNDNSTYGNVVLTSTLDDGLAFVGCSQITAHASITTSVSGSFDAFCASPTVINSGRNITFTFGSVRNSNTSTGSAKAVTVQFTAVVLNTATNNTGDTTLSGNDLL